MKLLHIALIASAAFPAAAFAQADNQLASVQVSATVEPRCAFTTVPAAVVTVTPDVGEKDLGNLGYTCNFVGSAQLVLELPNGTNLVNPSNGGDTVNYGLRWLLPPNNSGTAYQNGLTGSIPFGWPTGATPNTEISGALQIKLDAPLTVAGTYTSTITYTVAP